MAGGEWERLGDWSDFEASRLPMLKTCSIHSQRELMVHRPQPMGISPSIS